MPPFQYTVNPAIRLQLGFHMALFNGLSGAMLSSLQQAWRLNLQIGGGMLARRAMAAVPASAAAPAVRYPRTPDERDASVEPENDVTPGAAAMATASTSAETEAAKRFRHAFAAHRAHPDRIDGTVRDGDDEADATIDPDGPAGTISAQGNMRGNPAR